MSEPFRPIFRPQITKNRFSIHGNGISQDRYPVRYNDLVAVELAAFFEGKSYPFRRYDFSSTFERFHTEVSRFCICLDAYIEAGGKIPYKFLIEGVISGPEFTEYLKDYKLRFFVKKCIDGHFYEEVDFDLDRFGDIVIDDIDQIFPARDLIFYEEKVSDYLHGSIPLVQDVNMIEQFKEKVKDIFSLFSEGELADETISKLDIVLSLSKSKSLIDGKSRFNFQKKYKGQNLDNYFSRNIGLCKRTVIPIPRGFRDSVMLEPEALHSVKLLEDRATVILKDLPYHAYYAERWRILQAKRKFEKNHCRSFICRDLKKEGITKPRNLLRIIIEELSRIFPELVPLTNFYSDFSLDLGEPGIFFPARGHGLGMANALTTIMQLAVLALVQEELVAKGFDHDQIGYLTYNDDCAVCIPHDYVDDWIETEEEIFKGLGLILNPKKSYYSAQGYNFCELYFKHVKENFHSNDYQRRRDFLMTLSFSFIHEAKDYYRSVMNLYSCKEPECLEEIISVFGYEFFPEESLYPSLFGGWYEPLINGFSRAIFSLEELPFDMRVISAYEAGKLQKIQVFDRKRREKTEDIQKLFRYITEELPGLGNRSSEAIRNDYWIYGRSFQGLQAREALCKRRLKRYREIKPEISQEDFIRKLLSENERLIPPIRYLERKEPDIFFSRSSFHSDPYRQITPLLDLFAYFDNPLGEGGIPELYTLKYFPQNEKEPSEEAIFIGDEAYNLPGENIAFHEPSFLEDQETDLNPIEFQYCLQSLYGRNFYLKRKIPLKDKEVSTYRKQPYGRLLDIEEYSYLSLNPRRRKRFKYVEEPALRRLWNEDQTLEENEEDILQAIEELLAERKVEEENSRLFTDSGSEDSEIGEIVALMKKPVLTEILIEPVWEHMDPDELADSNREHIDDEIGRRLVGLRQLHFRYAIISDIHGDQHILNQIEEIRQEASTRYKGLMHRLYEGGYYKDFCRAMFPDIYEESDFGDKDTDQWASLWDDPT